MCSVSFNHNDTYLASASKSGKIIIQKLDRSQGTATTTDTIIFNENEKINQLKFS
jgi:hypothetical protein